MPDFFGRELAPLGDDLLWVAHYDAETQVLSVYDPSRTFSVDKIFPPVEELPTVLRIDRLTDLASDEIYSIGIRQGQTFTLQGSEVALYSGTNFVHWK